MWRHVPLLVVLLISLRAEASNWAYITYHSSSDATESSTVNWVAFRADTCLPWGPGSYAKINCTSAGVVFSDHGGDRGCNFSPLSNRPFGVVEPSSVDTNLWQRRFCSSSPPTESSTYVSIRDYIVVLNYRNNSGCQAARPSSPFTVPFYSAVGYKKGGNCFPLFRDRGFTATCTKESSSFTTYTGGTCRVYESGLVADNEGCRADIDHYQKWICADQSEYVTIPAQGLDAASGIGLGMGLAFLLGVVLGFIILYPGCRRKCKESARSKQGSLQPETQASNPQEEASVDPATLPETDVVAVQPDAEIIPPDEIASVAAKTDQAHEDAQVHVTTLDSPGLNLPTNTDMTEDRPLIYEEDSFDSSEEHSEDSEPATQLPSLPSNDGESTQVWKTDGKTAHALLTDNTAPKKGPEKLSSQRRSMMVREETMIRTKSSSKLSKVSGERDNKSVNPLLISTAEEAILKGSSWKSELMSAYAAEFSGTRLSIRVLKTRKLSGEQLAAFSHSTTKCLNKLSSISHPNVEKIHGFFTLPDSSICYFTNALPERALEALIDSDGPMEADTAAKYLLLILRALNFFHSAQKMNHGCLTLQKIQFSPTGKLLLTEAGLNLDLLLLDQEYWPASIAPEILAGGEQSTASDMWALGAICLEMITGKPYSQKNLSKTLQQVSNPLISMILNQCLVEDPQQRPSAASVLSHVSGN